MKGDRDLLHLQHMLDAVEAITEYTADGHDAFMEDRRTRDAVVRNLEIIGEAAKRLSQELRDHVRLRHSHIIAPKALLLGITPWNLELHQMPKAVIHLSDRANRVVNIVKAKEGLRGKSDALERIVEAYEEFILEPHFRPEFVEEVEKIRRGRFRKVKDPGALLD